MNEAGEEGAAAAAQYFMRLYSYAYATNDLADWEAISHEECVFCESAANNVRDQEQQGQARRGGAVHLDVDHVRTVSDRMWSVRGDLSVARQEVIAADGEVVHELDANSGFVAVIVTYENGEWSLAEVDLSAEKHG